MSFLTPLFLVGLAGLAIPVLIHLIQRERRRTVDFPSLMFVRRIPYQSVRRRRIRHWPLLLVRLALLALIVSAFARPFLVQSTGAAAGSVGAREVVVLLDSSYSMGYGERWEQARARVREAIDGLGADDRASVVAFSTEPEIALRSTSDKGRLRTALGTIELSAGATRFGPALKLAGSILSESSLPRREVIVVSDFQRTGWQAADGVHLPDRTTVTTHTIGAGETSNAAVTPVALERTAFENQERLTVTAGIVNRGNPLANASLALEINGRPIQTKQINIDADGAGSVTFDPVTIASANTRGTVRIGTDALVRDNAFHFVVSPSEPVPVLIVERGGSSSASLYLTRALSIGDAPKFQPFVKAADNITNDDLTRARVLILNDVQASSNLAGRIGAFVERGGGALIAFGERAAWPAGAPDILPGAPQAFVERTRGEAGRLAGLEYGHPIFELFRAPRTGDFSAARFYGYRGLTMRPATSPAPADTRPAAASAPASSVQVLARFDDGAPALAERTVGRGRVMVWTSALDLSWSDFALKPVYLPFVQRVARHLSAYSESAPWRTIGQVVDKFGGSATSGPETPGRVALTPSGRQVTLDAEETEVLQLAEQGFYEIRPQTRAAGTVAIVASNVDLSESDLTTMDPKEMVAAVTGVAGGTAVAAQTEELTPEARERTQRLWWYLLFAGILLLGIETVLAHRFSRTV